MINDLIKWFDKNQDFLIENIPNFLLGLAVLAIVIWIIW